MVALDVWFPCIHHSQYGTIGKSHTNTSFGNSLPGMDGNRCRRNGSRRHLRLPRASNVLEIIFPDHPHRVNRRT